MRIGLSSIVVHDQNQAERFYTEVLGFQVKTSAPYGPDECWLSVVAPTSPTGWSWCCTWPTSRHGRSRRPTARPAGAVAAHRRCAAEAERLKAKGVVFVKEPGRMAYGGIDAVFADTCGNLINLQE